MFHPFVPKQRKKLSIKFRYLSSVVPFLLLSYFMILLFLTFAYWKQTRTALEKQCISALSNASSSLNEDLMQFDLDSGIILYKNAMQEALNNVRSGGDHAAKTLSTLWADSITYYPTLGSPFVSKLYLSAANGDLFTFHGKITDPLELTKAKRIRDELLESTKQRHGRIHVDLIQHDDALFIAREAYLWTGNTSSETSVYLATLIGQLAPDHLQRILDTQDPSLFFLIIDSGGKILYSQNTQDVTSQVSTDQNRQWMVDGKLYKAITEKLISDELTLALVYDPSVILRGLYRYLFLALTLSGISIVLILVTVYSVSAGISNDFQFFINKLENTSTLDPSAYVQMDSIKEFLILSEKYNEMLRRIQTLTIQFQEQQLLAKDAQIKSLQSQINPHFLYNTLNCIRGLIEMNRKEDSMQALIALSNIEHMSIKGPSLHTLEEDLFYVRQYMFIQHLRFENRLLFLEDIPEDLQQSQIPKLIIQPLLENAIIHGISEVEHKGMILLQGEVKDDCLILKVKDNGPGFPESYPEKMSHADHCPGEYSEGTSFGLYNIDRRLWLTYGPEYGLSFSNNPNGGACVTVRLPLHIKQRSAMT